MRETGFYSVKVSPLGNSIAAYWDNESKRWSKILCLKHFSDSDFCEIGEKIKL